jgi:CxxC motif-containing protein
MSEQTENMKRELICITCPIGCHLSVEKDREGRFAVTGNRCSRGEVYAREELLSPRRVVSATCGIAAAPPALHTAEAQTSPASASLYSPRRIPVRTREAFPREKIPELLDLIYRLELPLPVKRGQVAIAGALGTGIDLIVERSIP